MANGWNRIFCMLLVVSVDLDRCGGAAPKDADGSARRSRARPNPIKDDGNDPTPYSLRDKRRV